MKSGWPVLLLVIACRLLARDRIADIGFFGYKGVDLAAVRKALPVRPGATSSEETKHQVRDAVKLVTGRDATDVASVCCDPQGDSVLFVGIAGRSSATFALNPEPAREAQLAVRRCALGHEDEIFGAGESASDGEQRAIAAEAVGYAHPSDRQIKALVRASRDANENVRNNAARALGELAAANTGIAIPPDTYIDMLRSGVWTDRNKASFLLLQLIRWRDPQFLSLLRAEASDALRRSSMPLLRPTEISL